MGKFKLYFQDLLCCNNPKLTLWSIHSNITCNQEDIVWDLDIYNTPPPLLTNTRLCLDWRSYC